MVTIQHAYLTLAKGTQANRNVGFTPCARKERIDRNGHSRLGQNVRPSERENVKRAILTRPQPLCLFLRRPSSDARRTTLGVREKIGVTRQHFISADDRHTAVVVVGPFVVGGPDERDVVPLL